MQHILQALPKNMEFSSEVCDRHEIEITKMIVNEKVVCPRCFVDKQTLELQKQQEEIYKRTKRMRDYKTLYDQSLVSDESLLKATIDNYVTECDEEVRNKSTVIECIERYKAGQVFNVVFQGTPGTGKSHLAYSVLREINESSNYKTSCLFINVEAMLRKIRSSFSDKDSRYTEDYFVDLISKVNYLVLDDIGAETGAIDTDKVASDFVQRIFYAITTARQNKATIITTNLSSEILFSMYDRKLVSRMFNRPKYIIFKESKDKRMTNIPF